MSDFGSTMTIKIIMTMRLSWLREQIHTISCKPQFFTFLLKCWPGRLQFLSYFSQFVVGSMVSRKRLIGLIKTVLDKQDKRKDSFGKGMIGVSFLNIKFIK